MKIEDMRIRTLEQGLQQMGEQIKSARFAEMVRQMVPDNGKFECRLVVLKDKRKGGLVLNMALRTLGEKKQRGTLLSLE